jgi:hypothetical protein
VKARPAPKGVSISPDGIQRYRNGVFVPFDDTCSSYVGNVSGGSMNGARRAGRDIDGQAERPSKRSERVNRTTATSIAGINSKTPPGSKPISSD